MEHPARNAQMGYIQIWPLTESDGEQVALEDLVAKDPMSKLTGPYLIPFYRVLNFYISY